MHIVWINDRADLQGGCERYIQTTASLLTQRYGVRHTLLYEATSPVSMAMLEGIDQAFPIVDLPNQLEVLQPDFIYGHAVRNVAHWKVLAECEFPVVRFLHDHKLFCPREHKYKTVSQNTCRQCVGLRCYSCLGVVNRSSSWPGLAFTSVGSLRDEHEICQALDGIVVGSEYMARHLAEHGFAQEKTHVLPLFATPPINGGPAIRDPQLLLFAGQLTRGKGIDLLLMALAKTPTPVRLQIIGSGPQEKELKSQSQQLGLGDRVEFVGKVSPEELSVRYRQASCLVLPSRTPETFGLVGVEAMSHGTPVIASDVGGIGQWLKDGVNGLSFPSGDVEKLSMVINRMTNDAPFATWAGDNAKQTYESSFRPERHVERLLKVVSSICKRKATA